MKRLLAVLLATSLIAVSGMAQAKHGDDRRHEKQAYHNEGQNHHRRPQADYAHKGHHQKDRRRDYKTKKYGHWSVDRRTYSTGQRYHDRGLYHNRHHRQSDRLAYFQHGYPHRDYRYGKSTKHRHNKKCGYNGRHHRKHIERRHDHHRGTRDDRISYVVGGAVLGSILVDHLNRQYEF